MRKAREKHPGTISLSASSSDGDDDSSSSRDDNRRCQNNKAIDADSSSVCEEESSTNTGSSGRTPRESGLSDEQEIKQLSARETQTIRCWRWVVLVLILAVGAAVAAGSYRFLSAQEESKYDEGYNTFSAAVEDTSTYYVKNLHQTTRGLAESITEYAADANETFPFVTIDIFETLARHVREQSGIESLVYSPIVYERERDDWEAYSVDNQGWIQQSIRQYRPSVDLVSSKRVTYGKMDPIFPKIYTLTEESERNAAALESSYAPYWHVSPLPSTTYFINSNQFQTPYFDITVFNAASIAREGVYTQKVDISSLAKDNLFGTNTHVAYHEQFLVNELTVTSALNTPHAYLVEPVFAEVSNPSAPVVGYIQALVPFDRFLSNVLPEGVSGVYAVLQNTCGEVETYVLNGNKATYLGMGDQHDPAFDYSAVTIPLYQYLRSDLTSRVSGHCSYSFVCYSSKEYINSIKTSVPGIVLGSVCCIFLFVAMTFIFYDRFVQRRNSIVLSAATKSHAILSSLFPSNIRDRLYEERTEADRQKGKGDSNLATLLSGDGVGVAGVEDGEMGYVGKPIADLFTESTVLFADISGFTAWSSQREPAQVFTLLETLYRAFDEIAKKRRVFKVETIGDCYVAVTGVPEPQKAHAQIMCRFARDILIKSRYLMKRLETTLGPDTGELDLRIGIHSGPVTAGVLRGERSRFQLFGDTMNTASRTESTGVKGKIQVTQETADILLRAGKSHWITPREETVVAKGKGIMTTFWLSPKADGGGSSVGGSSESGVEDSDDCAVREVSSGDYKISDLASDKIARLIEWNCELLHRILKQIAAQRAASAHSKTKANFNENDYVRAEGAVIDEVQEIVALPDAVRKRPGEAEMLAISPAAVDQLFDYVSNIAALYRNVHFHSFEHGAHVTMSVSKLLSRIVAPANAEESGKTLHDHSFGITSDYLTQFSCIFSALIHDVDHTGAPNAQLIKEGAQIADYYKNRSVAEQHSVDIAWNLLMDDSYSELRRAIYTTPEELQRFRALVVNSVMATDIVDKDLKALRNARWEKAFSESAAVESAKDAIDRKATIVIEHLIQASDVSHTMQHWHIYRKWNERFFFECYKAYKDGRAEHDPSDSWYTGELGFFDYYIIPLAKKLKDCGVFGVSSDEYLNYAQRNRMEWEARGEEVVQEMIARVQGNQGGAHEGRLEMGERFL